jgi:hypothetical protein
MRLTTAIEPYVALALVFVRGCRIWYNFSMHITKVMYIKLTSGSKYTIHSNILSMPIIDTNSSSLFIAVWISD